MGAHKARPYEKYLHGMKDSNLATEWKRQEMDKTMGDFAYTAWKRLAS